MKKNNSLKQLAIVLLFLASMKGMAQPYGQSEYINSNANYTLGKGLYYQGGTPGFVMAGYVATGTLGISNFVVYRTMPGGGLTGTAWTKGYIVDWNPGCNSSQTQVLAISQLNMIETTDPSNVFVVAFSNDDGLFLTGIQANGNPGTLKTHYPFPVGSQGATKPHLIQLSTNDYMICGSYEISGIVYMYVLKVDPNGSTIQSKVYDPNGGTGNTIVPSGIVESPYNHYSSSEVAIVGTIQYDAVVQEQGFLMIMNHSSFNIDKFSEYHVSSNSRETFGAITLSSINGGSYLIHGSTNQTGLVTANFYPTLMNVDPDGITTNWSNEYGTIAASTTHSVVTSVLERLNSNNNYDFFFGYNDFANGAHVGKINQNGNWFSVGTNTVNEAIYPASGISDLKSISFNNNSGNDEGLHIFGNSPNNNFLLIQAHFNLISNPNLVGSGCTFFFETPNLATTQNTSTSLSNGTVLNVSAGLSDCQTQITLNNENVTHNQICGGSISDVAGDNTRKVGINELKHTEVRLYPILADESITVEGWDNFTFKILAMDGKFILKGKTSQIINTQEIENGIYLLSIEKNGQCITKKIVIQH